VNLRASGLDPEEFAKMQKGYRLASPRLIKAAQASENDRVILPT
jgi:hypothetical protein